MNIRTTLIASSLIAASLVSGAAHAALQGRDLNGSIDSFEAYYDTDLNITWLADAAASSGNFFTARTWVADLSFTDGVNIYDSWRLPALDPADGVSFDYRSGGGDIGYGVGASTVYGGPRNELAYMYYTTLQMLASINGSPRYIPFNGVGFTYWSGDNAFYFRFEGGGYQSAAHPTTDIYNVWAVSDGDVGIAAVPEPSTYAMMLAGLGLVGFMAQRRKRARIQHQQKRGIE